MDVGSREVEGVGTQLWHSVTVHINLVFLAAIDAKLIAPSVGSYVLAEGYLYQYFVVGQCFVVH